MPYIHTVTNTPTLKVYIPMQGMGDDTAFRYVACQPGKGTITIRAIAGREVEMDLRRGAELLNAISDIHGYGADPIGPDIRRPGSRIHAVATTYSIETEGQPVITMTGMGLFMLSEALANCLDAIVAARKEQRDEHRA